MKGIIRIIVLLLLTAGLYFWYVDGGIGQQTDEGAQRTEQALQLKEMKVEKKSTPENHVASTNIKGELYHWIGRDADDLQTEFGEPVRKDLSSYGYTWWVYSDRTDQYLQFGVQGNKIVTVYGTGEGLSMDTIYIGQSYDEIKSVVNLADEATITKDGASYRFQLTEEEMRLNPLLKLTEEMETKPFTMLEEDTFMQLYFDTFTNKLSSIRILTPDVLLMHRPYEVFYRGTLPEMPVLTEEEWSRVQQGMEQQIFDVTNIIRQRHDVGKLEWDEQVAKVAYGHSKDMAVNNYFSHYTLTGEGLKERLREGEIAYFAAGENIAAQYTDGPAAVEGWLNSLGHREALLKEDYTHLGVGVHNYYYTQNFLQKP